MLSICLLKKHETFRPSNSFWVTWSRYTVYYKYTYSIRVKVKADMWNVIKIQCNHSQRIKTNSTLKTNKNESLLHQCFVTMKLSDFLKVWTIELPYVKFKTSKLTGTGQILLTICSLILFFYSRKRTELHNMPFQHKSVLSYLHLSSFRHLSDHRLGVVGLTVCLQAVLGLWA